MLSDALDVLGLAVAVATTYIGFGTVPAGFVLAGALFLAGFLLDKSGRPEVTLEQRVVSAFRAQRAARSAPSPSQTLTNGHVDAAPAKRS